MAPFLAGFQFRISIVIEILLRNRKRSNDFSMEGSFSYPNFTLPDFLRWTAAQFSPAILRSLCQPVEEDPASHAL